ncbi:MAG: toll/interleukin-1 receptor domain-containing protein [Calditrichaeota bacterium]|nr:toll/interleukin-1 receptor domain-containing protein [Calditrichota bacterium]
MSYSHVLEKILGDLSRITQNPQVHILSSVEAVRIIQNCIINLESLHQHLVESDETGGFCLAIIKSASDSLNAILEFKAIAKTPNADIHDRIRQVAENLTGCEEELANISAAQNQMILRFDNPDMSESEITRERPLMRSREIKNLFQNQIFISYSHKDIQWMERLKIMLKPLEMKYRLNIWDDQKIRPGDKWQEEIDKTLAAAKLAILLVSPDFLNSEFIMERELPYLMKASKTRGLRILWIPLSFCLYQETELNQLQATSNPENPLDSMTKSEADKLLVEMGIMIKKELGV